MDAGAVAVCLFVRGRGHVSRPSQGGASAARRGPDGRKARFSRTAAGQSAGSSRRLAHIAIMPANGDAKSISIRPVIPPHAQQPDRKQPPDQAWQYSGWGRPGFRHRHPTPERRRSTAPNRRHRPAGGHTTARRRPMPHMSMSTAPTPQAPSPHRSPAQNAGRSHTAGALRSDLRDAAPPTAPRSAPHAAAGRSPRPSEALQAILRSDSRRPARTPVMDPERVPVAATARAMASSRTGSWSCCGSRRRRCCRLSVCTRPRPCVTAPAGRRKRRQARAGRPGGEVLEDSGRSERRRRPAAGPHRHHATENSPRPGLAG